MSESDVERGIEDPVPAPPQEPAETDRPRGGVDPRPPSQIEAEEGAREGLEEADPRLRATEIASARAYAEHGIYGAPGSEADPGGDLPEPYPYTGVRPPSQVAAEDDDPEAAGAVPGVEGAPGTEPGQDAKPEAKDPAGTAPAEGQP